MGSCASSWLRRAFLCLAISSALLKASPVTIPYLENFTAGSGSFSPSPSNLWAVSAEKYRATPSSSNPVAAAAVESPSLTTGFRMEATLAAVTNTDSGNTCGLAFLAADGTFNSGTSASYYLADVKPGQNKMRFVRVASSTTFILDDHTLSFTLDPLQPFKVSVQGTYLDTALSVRITITQGANESVHIGTDSTRLTGNHFGLRCRAGTGSMTIDYDNFSLRSLSTVDFTNAPLAFAQPSELYQSTVNATTTVSGGSATIIAEQLPSWMSLSGGTNGTATLSGTPPAGTTGATTIRLRAEDGNGAPLTKEFPLNVLGVSGVIISEFLASSDGAYPDEDGDDSDWLELLNASNTAVDLSGWSLRDDETTWIFPNGTTLGPYATMVVFASDKNRLTQPFHTNFKLSSSAGGYLALVRPDNSIASEYASYPAQREGISYGRWGNYEASGYLLTPTPNADNSGQGYLGFLPDPQFSIPRGNLFSTPQSLVISSTVVGGTISYTTDGSTPTLAHGTIVSPPSPSGTPQAALNISSTTPVRAGVFLNGYAPSTVITNTYIFPDDVVAQSPNGAPPGPGWPAGPVNGQLLYYGMHTTALGATIPDPPTALKNALKSLPTFSMVTDLPNLFDPAIGNYVNAYEREEGFERPVSMELIRPDGSSAFHVNCGYRMRGGVSRADGNPKHSFHFYFRGEYGFKKLEYPLFDNQGASEFDRIDLRSTQGGSWHQANDSNATYMKDEWSRATQGAMGHPHTRSRYCHLYINGHYWGIYATQERADNAFAASYFGGEKEDYDIIKTYVLPHRVEAADGDAIAWNTLHAKATAGFANDADYFAIQGLDPDGKRSATIKPLVEIDNLIDYMILNMFTSNTDGPVNPSANVPKNFYCFRPRDGSAGFRFVAHDFEDTFGGSDVTGNNNTGTTLAYFNPRWLHLQLAQNAKYRVRFGDRVQRNLFNNGALSSTNAQARWNEMKAILAPAMIAEAARWGDFKTHTTPRIEQWTSASNSIANGYMINRQASFITLLRSNSRGYTLFPSANVSAPVLSPSGGVVSPGTTLTMTGPASTQIYYTLDGTDPASLGAILYSGAITLNSASITVKARVRHNTTSEWSALTETTFTLPPVAAAPGNLSISEIHYNPSDGTDTRDFIEIHNPTSLIIDLTGAKITNGITFTFPALTLLPSERIVVVENESAFRALYGAAPRVAGVWDGNLSNSGEIIELRAANDTMIESVTYSDASPWPKPPDGGGPSLVRIRPDLPPNAASSWRPSSANHGTPSASDSNPLASWLSTHGLADGNVITPVGLKALVHYASGTTPSIHPSPAAITRASGNDTVTFRRQLSSIDDVRYFIEQSTDLSAWPVSVEIESASSTILSRVMNGDGTETIAVRVPATSGNTFYRLRYATR